VPGGGTVIVCRGKLAGLVEQAYRREGVTPHQFLRRVIRARTRLVPPAFNCL